MSYSVAGSEILSRATSFYSVCVSKKPDYYD